MDRVCRGGVGPKGSGRWTVERGCGRAVVLTAIFLGLSASAGAQAAARTDDLPDAPSALLADSQGQGTETSGGGGSQATSAGGSGQAQGSTAAGKTAEAHAPALRPCKDYPARDTAGRMPLQGPPPCIPENPVEPIVTSAHVQPLDSEQKGRLALKIFMDPFNFVTIAGYSAIAVAWNPHSAYGPAFKGWAKLTGYGVVEDAQAEFFAVYAIPSLLHEDPRYHRVPNASLRHRIWHAIEHTYVSEHDDGRPMPNYATLLTYPISAELSNLYVPGIQTDAKATGKRVAIGIASDPSGTIVAEFLPDIAKHIHLHAQFVQELIDRAMTGTPTTTAQ